MIPIQSPNLPADAGGYVPYFYQRGLYRLYPLPGAGRPHPAYTGETGVYDFSRQAGPFELLDSPQTVEQIVQRGYFAVPAGDPVTALISDKGHTARLGLDDLIHQVRQRYELYERHFYQIQLAKCAAINAIYQHEAYRGEGSASSRQHYAKHKAIQDLYAQEREERVELWRDVSRLKLLLPESAQSYLGAHRKLAALNTPAGDAE
jgi:hypothetical protein